ncbi:MAG: cupin domain-containing protein [Oceanicaulis sp.]
MNTNSTPTRLDEGWMMDAASGAAPRAVRVLAACHGALNPSAAATLDAAESAFGALLESGPRAPVSPDLYATVLERLDIGEPDREPDAPRSGWLPRPLVGALAQSGSPGWRKRFGGYHEIVLSDLCEPGVRARLLSIPKGKGAPEHDHEGEELTLVLAGSFVDGRGRYERGDACVAEPGVVHRPRVDSDETCICFAVELGEWRLTNPMLSTLDRLFSRRH